MREREQLTKVVSHGANGVIEVKTDLVERRGELFHKLSVASGKKDDAMYKELGKTGLSIGAIAAAGAYGIEQIVDGFNHSQIREVENGALVVVLAALLIPLTRRFYHEAVVARREKKEIDKARKSP